MSTTNELWNKYFGKDEPKPTDIICPITGSILMSDGSDRNVMDGDHFYYASSDNTIRYSRHPFQWDLFRLVSHRHNGEQGIRFFKLLDDKTWEEYITDKRTDQLFPISTPQSEIEKFISIELKEREEKHKLYVEGVANGTIIPMFRRKLLPSMISISEIIEAQPLGPPTGKLYYLNLNIDK